MRNSVLALCLLLLFAACEKSTSELHEDLSPESEAFIVSVDEARSLASSVLPEKNWALVNLGEELPAYYIFNGEEGGFVIVSAYEAAEPILGYSETNRIEPSDMPLGLQELLGGFSKEIYAARKMGLSPTHARLEERGAMLRAETSLRTIVEPLLGEISWNQGRGYNAFTPDYTPVGCVATAAAMIMRYWEYPERGRGVYQYRSGRFGMRGHDYNYSLLWDKMPLNSSELERLSGEAQREAIFHTSRFSYGVAVALDMNFNYGENGGSGTYQKLVPGVLRKFYNYPPTVKNLFRDDYTAEEWEVMLRTELDAERPVQYAGRGEGGGHSFVIDGYKENGFYSLNWGWGGRSNGWFQLSALSPDELGEGGGTGGFNMDHEMIVGFEPPARVSGEKNDNVDELLPPQFGKPVALPSLDLFIKYTKFNDVETPSIAGGFEVYTDKEIVVENGQLKTVITPHFLRPDAKAYILLSIDLNHNGTFNVKEDGDLIISFKELSSGESVNELVDLMKYNVKPKMGETYTMRVNISAYGYANPNYMISGEVEDYTVVIK